MSSPSPRRHRRPYRASLVTPLFDVNVGLALAWKEHYFLTTTEATRYSSGAHSQFIMGANVYPFRLTHVSALHWLGLRLRFAHSAGLSTLVTDPQAAGSVREVGTDISCYWGGFVGRIPRWHGRHAPQLSIFFGIAINDFSVLEQTDITDFMVTELAAGGAVFLPIHRLLRLRVSGEYRALAGASSAALVQHRVSVGSAHGFHIDADVTGRIIHGLGYGVIFTYERLRGSLAPLGASESPLDLGDSLLTIGAMLTYEI